MRENQCVDDTDKNFLWYLSDTAPGSSGAPVFNDSFQLAALHHSGKAKQENGKYILRNGNLVDSLDGVDDSLIEWVANEGIRISRICSVIKAEAKEQDEHLAELQLAMQTGDVLSNAFQNPTQNESMNQPLAPFNQNPTNGAITVPVVLDLRLSLFGQALAPASSAVNPHQLKPKPIAVEPDASGSGAGETYKQPIVDTDYSSRKGFNVNFLGIKTALPTLTDSSVAAHMKGGTKTVIPYEHFSVVMHKARRLAIYTASNVDWSKAARRPEAGKDYSRDALGGFTKNDEEEWVIDPRLDEAYQVTDNFYRRDKGAFDKGHLVRRDDVCWGADYAEVQRANGDTYHLPNCSPQIAGFNRSASRGEWGLLENFVQSQGKSEKYCVFAGPILADDDQDFVGKESGNSLKINVPKKFWKVVTVVNDGALKAYGFMLEQDLADVPAGVEFEPTDEWIGKMSSLKDIEAEAQLFTFPKALHDADQGA